MNEFNKYEKEYPILISWRAYNFGKSLTLLFRKLKSILYLSIIFTLLLCSLAFCNDNQRITYTSTDISLNGINQNEGACRLAQIISKRINEPVTVSKFQLQNGSDGSYRYKLTLDSNISWVKGVWIVNLVPYTQENMSIETARKKNKDYDFWYVYYENKKPKYVAWARYGN